jgi:hypothetical protein
LTLSLRYYTVDVPDLSTREALQFSSNDVVRAMTRAAIRRFVNEHRDLLDDNLLDYGCGAPGTCAVPQPYRQLISPRTYTGWEPGGGLLTSSTYTGVLCTQVLQNVEDPAETLKLFYDVLKPGCHLVLTYPTAWEEMGSGVDHEYWRFTQHGAWLLAHKAGFHVVKQEVLARVVLDGALNLALVEGMVARK